MDEKSKKQLMIIGALVPVLLISWVFALRGCGMFPAERKAPAAAPVVPTAPASLPRAQGSPAVVSARDEAIEKYESISWVRNPFRLAVANVPAIVADTRPAIPNMKLEGIVWDRSNPYAIIDGEVRTIGDLVAGYTVSEITKEKVVLERGGDKYELGLFPELR